jgi:hypothetical protein
MMWKGVFRVQKEWPNMRERAVVRKEVLGVWKERLEGNGAERSIQSPERVAGGRKE